MNKRVDDSWDDAAAAYKEVFEKTSDTEIDDDLVEEETSPEPVARSGKAPAKAADDNDEADAGDDDTGGRDQNGRFKPKAAKPAAKPSKATPDKGEKPVVDSAKAAEGEESADPAQQQPTATKPPPSWSVKAKAAWNALPPEVREDIAKREGEVAQGLSALRDFKDLKPWAEMASKHGTTIGDALKRYVGIEQVLQKNIGLGIATIVQNRGFSKQQAAALFADMAKRYGADQNAEPDPVADALNPLLSPLQQQIADLQSKLTSRETAEQSARLGSLDQALKTLEADTAFPYLPDLLGDMTFLIEQGRVPKSGNDLEDLKAAYQLAARLNPQVHEALIEQRLTDAREAERKKEQEAAAKARSASRSLSGSRMPGAVTREAQSDGGIDDVEADVRAAMRAVGAR